MATSRICSIPDCGKPHFGLGYCQFHYQRFKRYGDPLAGPKKRLSHGYYALCTVIGCTNKHYARGLCGKHYHRLERHGDPLLGGTERSAAGEPAEWVLAHVTHDGDDCLFWPFSRYPDGAAGLIWNGERVRGPRLMCELAHGPAPADELHAAHSCGKGHLGCMNPKHLRWATPTENAADMLIHGTRLRGITNPRSKLTPEQVQAIRSRIGIDPHIEIARDFGVSPMTVSAIKARRVWAWLP